MPPGWRDGIAAAEARAATEGRTRLQIAQATDMSDWLPHDLLLKLDRCLMAHGGRGSDAVPGIRAWLPPRSACQTGLKVRDGRGKWLLRRWLEQAQPKAHPFAPKRGFHRAGQPLDRALRRPIGPARGSPAGMWPNSPRQTGSVALFREADHRRHGFAAWTLLFYALWHRAHIERGAIGGDTFDVLAAR